MEKLIKVAITFAILIYPLTVQSQELSKCPPSGLVTQCCEISEANVNYVLQNNVSSQGTCFSINASNFTFDLNGNTVYFAQSQTGHAFHDYWNNEDNITITNGNIVGDQNLGLLNRDSHAIYFQTEGSSNINLNHLNIEVTGIQAQGIVIGTGNDLDIHDLNIVLNSEKEDPCSHYGGHIAGIAARHRGGVNKIYNNSITGSGMQGISFTDCGIWDANDPMLIYNNFISMQSPVRDGYAIWIAGLDNSCSDGMKIYDNEISQISGRGIGVAGWNTGSDWGPGNVEIYNNNIYVQEGPDCEYNAAGTGVGFIIRFGAHDIHLHDNIFRGQAGVGVAPGTYQGDDPNRNGSTVNAIKIDSSRPYGVNNVIENNLVDISTNDARFPAIGVYLTGGNYDNQPVFTQFRNNTYKSNSQPIRISYTDSGGYNADFDADTIVRGDNPLGYKSITMGYWCYGAANIDYIDFEGQSGASVYDMQFISVTEEACPVTHFENIKISWTLEVRMEDNSGNPLDGYVEILSNQQVYDSGNTTNGIFKSKVVEKSFDGINSAQETDHNPYTVRVNYQGNIKTSEPLNITGKRTEVFKYSEVINPDTTAPYISDGGPDGVVDNEGFINLSVLTNEEATCKFSDIAGTPYASMQESFDTNNSLNHTKRIDGIQPGLTYSFYVRCLDKNGNINQNDYEISFWVAGNKVNPDDFYPQTGGDNLFEYQALGGCSSLLVDSTGKNSLALFFGLFLMLVLLGFRKKK